MMILPAAYLPSIEYCARWAQGPCVVDGGEHFVKRSERNRTHILTAGGVLTLTAKNKVRLLPALNIPFELLEEAVAIMKGVLEE